MADATDTQGDLFEGQSLVPDGTTAVNGRCTMRTRDGHRVVVVAGVALLHYALGDAMAEAHAMVSLVGQGWATQVEVARAFGCTTRTVRRHQQRFEDGGLAALGRRAGYPPGRPREGLTRARRIHRLRADGLSLRDIASRVGVTEKAVRKSLRRLGWKETVPEQPVLPLVAAGADPNLSAPAPSSSLVAASSVVDTLSLSSCSGADPNLSGPQGTSHGDGAAPSMPVKGAQVPAGAHPNLSASDDDEPLPCTSDQDPADRSGDRLYAYLGLLDDAAPLFRPGTRVPGAGVLLAIPALLRTGVLRSAREVYGSIGPAFYGLRTTILALVLLALLRIKRPEALKEHTPEDLGRILGLDRAPEVKTVRRKLARLGALGRAAAFGRALAERRVASHAGALGFLYTDGHVRVYHGQRAIPKAHVTRMRISLPATTDYWVHDAQGEPLFVVTAQANAGLAKMLLPLLEEIRSLVGERRVTVVFDRGGWSPKLFQEILAKGDFDLLTYRKGRSRRVPLRLFREHTAEFDGRQVTYVLADRETRLLGARLRLRQVTRLSPDGHQTPIITSRRDLPPIEVAYRMFERWREENFFKYLRDEYALDALVDYAVEPDDPAREVPNPKWNALSSKIRAARAEVVRLSARYGLEALGDADQRRRTLRSFEAEHAEEGRALWKAFGRVDALEKKRKKTPQRVPVRDVVQSDVVKLSTERKHLTNVIKMVAYQVESDLVHAIAPHYRRTDDEGRTLIQTALAAAADIDVADDELRVTLAPLSSAHRSRAVAALCDQLNASPVRFPGSRLRLRFAVAGVPDRTDP